MGMTPAEAVWASIAPVAAAANVVPISPELQVETPLAHEAAFGAHGSLAAAVFDLTNRIADLEARVTAAGW